jgi:hypothetical protein
MSSFSPPQRKGENHPKLPLTKKEKKKKKNRRIRRRKI